MIRKQYACKAVIFSRIGITWEYNFLLYIICAMDNRTLSLFSGNFAMYSLGRISQVSNDKEEPREGFETSDICFR